MGAALQLLVYACHMTGMRGCCHLHAAHAVVYTLCKRATNPYFVRYCCAHSGLQPGADATRMLATKATPDATESVTTATTATTAPYSHQGYKNITGMASEQAMRSAQRAQGTTQPGTEAAPIGVITLGPSTSTAPGELGRIGVVYYFYMCKLFIDS